MAEGHEKDTQPTEGSTTLSQHTDATEASGTGSPSTEESLREWEGLSRSVIEAATVGTYIIQEGRFQYINPEYATVSGYSAEELIGTSPLDYVHPDDREQVREKAIRHLKRLDRTPYEFRLVRKDGDIAWVLERVVSAQYRGKRATVGAFLDVTESKRIDEALRRRERDYQILCECTLDGLLVIDAETFNIVFANRAAADMYGFDSVEDAIGVSPLDFLPAEEQERAMRIIVEDMFEKDLREANEFRTITRGGTELWVSAVGTKTEYQGRMAGLISLRDITERKEAEKAFVESYEKLERMLGQTVGALTSAVELRDPTMAGHQRRVAHLASAIASEMGLPDFVVKGVHMAGLLHDVGAVWVPDGLLNKPASLNQAEYEAVKAQPQMSYDILKTIEFPWPVAEIVLQHRERMDGSGYPSGLSGEDILLEARILAVAEVVEAMSFERPYRHTPGLEGALAELERNRGVLFDAEAVDACTRLFREDGYRFKRE